MKVLDKIIANDTTPNSTNILWLKTKYNEEPSLNANVNGEWFVIGENNDEPMNEIAEIKSKIPSAANTENKLADKQYVSDYVNRALGEFKGTSEPDLTEEEFITWANSLNPVENDFVYWNTVDDNETKIYKRYQYDGSNWVFQYDLNNSSFTDDELAAIQSGITAEKVAIHDAKADKDTDAVAGNVAEFDANGNPVDSGVPKVLLQSALMKFTIDGDGDTFSTGPMDLTQFVPGRMYRFYMIGWSISSVTSGGTYLLLQIGSYNSEEQFTTIIKQYMGESLYAYYDVVIPGDSVRIYIGLRANSGSTVTVMVEDITDIPEGKMVRTDNLLNPNDVTYGSYVSRDTGKLVSGGSSAKSYAASGFIPIDDRGLFALDSYGGGVAIGYAYYSSTEESSFISGSSGESYGTRIPYVQNAAYVRLTLHPSYRDLGYWVVVPGKTPPRKLPYWKRQASAFAEGSIPANALLREPFTYNFNRGSNTVTYWGDVAELYIIAPNPGVITLKHFNGKLYLESRDSLSSVATAAYWSSVQDDTSIVNGDIVTLYATTGSETHNVSIGDVVGYIIFKDIADFRSKGTGNLVQPIDYDYCADFRNAPIIYSWLQSFLFSDTMENGIEVVLPSAINVVQGDNLQLFYRSCIKCVNPENYDIEPICSVGKPYPKYYAFAPTASHVGKSYTLTLLVRRNDGSTIASGSTTLRVIAKPTTPSATKNILTIGASVMSSGVVMAEVNRRLTAVTGSGTYYDPTGLGLSNIALVGRKTSSAGVKQDATGGWSWKDYATSGRGQSYRFQVTGVSVANPGDKYTAGGLTFTIEEVNITDGTGEISCSYTGSGTPSASGTLTLSEGEGDATITYTSYVTEGSNPFWNNGALDFTNYANTYCDGQIDIFVAYCGINDMFSTRSVSTTINYAKTFIRAFHTQFPNAKFVLATQQLPSPNGGMGSSYGASSLYQYYYIVKQFFDLAKAYTELADDDEFGDYVILCPAMQTFDSENAYPTTNMAVNNRSTKTWPRETNGVHPTDEAKKQISDAIFSSVSAAL